MTKSTDIKQDILDALGAKGGVGSGRRAGSGSTFHEFDSENQGTVSKGHSKESALAALRGQSNPAPMTSRPSGRPIDSNPGPGHLVVNGPTPTVQSYHPKVPLTSHAIENPFSNGVNKGIKDPLQGGE